jgi:hypothetical protein
MPFHKQLKGSIALFRSYIQQTTQKNLGLYKRTRLNLPLNWNENEKKTFVNELVIANELGFYH